MDLSKPIASSFWKNKRVFLTGHTGFKGGWLSIWLHSMGAKVFGYSLPPSTNPNFFSVAKVSSCCEKSYIGDIDDLGYLQKCMIDSRPDIVIHMAAQALVRYSYLNPIETFKTNVLGTAHVLESVRFCSTVRAVVIVTTDKCYENKEWIWGYRENDPIGGLDPYSSSKGCAELVTSAFRQSFFSKDSKSPHVFIASARAGNVIGGGDWSADRLMVDAIAAFEAKKTLNIRNPTAIRPWQHVLEPLSGYLKLAESLYFKKSEVEGAWNFGPRDIDARSVQEVLKILSERWGSPVFWEMDKDDHPHEANFLKLDCSKAKKFLEWEPRWLLEDAIDSTIGWHRAFRSGSDMQAYSISQIAAYLN